MTFSLFPPFLKEDEMTPVPPVDGVNSSDLKLSLFSPKNSMIPAISLPVRILQGGVSHCHILELKSERGVSTGVGGRTFSSRSASFGDSKKINVRKYEFIIGKKCFSFLRECFLYSS